MISVTTDRLCVAGPRSQETGGERKNSLPGAAIVSLPVKLLLASLRSSLTGRTEGGCSGQWGCGMSLGYGLQRRQHPGEYATVRPIEFSLNGICN